MKKFLAMLVMAGLVSGLSIPAFAIKPIADQFKEVYASPDSKDSSDAFKAAVKDAGCNICHVKDGDKKKESGRNPYGKALHEALKEAKFPVKDFGKDAKNAQLIGQLRDAFKKVAEKKAGGTDKTFAARMKAGELPGGDKDGKGLPEAK